MAETHITERQLWLGVTAGAAAWATHGLTVILICSQACKSGTGTWFDMPPAAVRSILGLITLVLLSVALLGGMTAFRSWRVFHGDAALRDDPADDRMDFMALTGLFASAAFVVGIVWAGIAVLFTSLCSNFH
jgi:hypothetical protein